MMNLELDHFLKEVPTGWHDLVKDTHKKIIAIDPEYRIRQIKEKFGNLRYYYEPSRLHMTVDIDKIIRTAEIVSSVICQDCGIVGASLVFKNGWYATLCDTHFEEWSK